MLGKNDKKTDDLLDLYDCLIRMHPEEFLGVAKILKVAIAEEHAKPRDAEQVFCEICDAFQARNRFQRRSLLKMCKQTVKGRLLPSQRTEATKEATNGSTTEDN